MGKTLRFDSSVDGDSPSTPFNPALADALANIRSASVPVADASETVVDVLASAVADTASVLAPSGDVAPLAEVAVEVVANERPSKTYRGQAPKATEAPKQDRTQKEIQPENFCDFPNEALVALVSAIRDGGAIPVVTLRASAGDVTSSIVFGLSVVPGDRIQLVIVGGEGIFRAVFGRCRFFRDELFGHREPPPDRMAPTASLRHLLDFVLSLPKA